MGDATGSGTTITLLTGNTTGLSANQVVYYGAYGSVTIDSITDSTHFELTISPGVVTFGSIHTHQNSLLDINAATLGAAVDISQSSIGKGLKLTHTGTTGDLVNIIDNSTERFTILQGGNVGINQDTPACALDVTGTFRATGNSSIGGTLDVTGNTTITGDLTVDGTTTTVNSTTLTVDDPIITLGGDTAPQAADSLDRGVEFRYYQGSAKVGFFGWDSSYANSNIWTGTGGYRFLVDATNSAEIFSGTDAPVIAGNLALTTNTGSTSTTTGSSETGMSRPYLWQSAAFTRMREIGHHLP